MKVIDLLNKIANGEEVPKKIKYRDWLYEFEKDCNDYLCQYDSLLYRENDDVKQFLNDEVEMIEEGIEKLDMKRMKEDSRSAQNEIMLGYKINEIIDFIKENK